ncbi:hypothetical protein CCACVL1_08434 [Corchorus capsularis]|uniref:Uncharacterized protein n=1 Tax=Corchorus capsularis TaxID=210143 RepID=A0A1R3J0M5_COCAP|nr:hypothetical protein CCACVL1_08434 [Corchorus capsularis]
MKNTNSGSHSNNRVPPLFITIHLQTNSKSPIRTFAALASVICFGF